MSNAIQLRGEALHKEGIAGAVVTPGYLIEQDTDLTWIPHANAGLNAAPTFALELAMLGKGIADDYADGDQIQVGAQVPGNEVYALVAASAAAILNNEYLESAGDGTLRIATTDAATDDTQREGIVARALEDVDNSGGGSEARIKVEIV